MSTRHVVVRPSVWALAGGATRGHTHTSPAASLEHEWRAPCAPCGLRHAQSEHGLTSVAVTQVIPDLGVGVTLYEIHDVEGGTVYPLEGAALFKVTFSLVRAPLRTGDCEQPAVQTLAAHSLALC